MSNDPIRHAARLISSADSLLITAGAGMGVDSGLPDFRGEDGFWQAYPALAKARIDFQSIANAKAFEKNPKRAWGFYGHRLALYRTTQPHRGFGLLQRFAKNMPQGAFVMTSNVDGQFQRSGFEEHRVLEIHGSIHRLQCCRPCRDTVWSTQFIEPVTDDEICEWTGPKLPTCDRCRQLARPNILMFNDWAWVGSRTESQRFNLERWKTSASAPVIIEIGAGVEIPSMRQISETRGYPLIRINPSHPNIREGTGVRIPLGALKALSLIAEELEKMGWLTPDDDQACQNHDV